MKNEAHTIFSIMRFGEKNAYGKIGVFMPTQKKGCYKLILDYQPAVLDAPIIIVVGSEETKYSAEIVEESWIVAGGEQTHRIYGYLPFGNPDSKGKRKSRRDRIGSVFRSSTNERIYMLKLNQWPRNPDIDILAFETTLDERFDKQAKVQTAT